jgi:hypothetical protein
MDNTGTAVRLWRIAGVELHVSMAGVGAVDVVAVTVCGVDDVRRGE